MMGHGLDRFLALQKEMQGATAAKKNRRGKMQLDKSLPLQAKVKSS